MQTLTKLSLRRRIFAVLRRQGYRVDGGSFALKDNSRENRRAVHLLARTERMSGSEEFILKSTPLIEKYLVDGEKIEIDRIDPQIVEVREGTLHETIFKWWNLVWWSLPYERAYGRQMRFVVWDRYHNAPIGLIGLQSPILSWGVRDKRLGIAADQRDYWVNQSMSAQRLGALPPYNYLLGGKLIASLMTTDVVRIGRSPKQLKHLIFTHGHPDHIGSAAAIVRETGATTYLHPLDIPMAESGGPFRPLAPAPGLLRRVLCKVFFHPNERVAAVAIDQPLTAGAVLPIAGGIEVTHVPGHCAGQVALLWRPGRMLFAGDVCMNVMGLGDPLGFENLEEGRASQRKLTALSFDAAGFGHGESIARDASTRLRNKYGQNLEQAHRQRSAA